MITLPSMISNGMILGLNARIWGWAKGHPSVSLTFLNTTYSLTPDAEGLFELELTFPDYGGPYTMEIGNITLTDIYIGKVWLCSGQSNMEQPLSRTSTRLGEFTQFDARIRCFQAEKNTKFDGPAMDVNGQWHTYQGDQMAHLFAVPYFFARKLLETDPHVKIGLLNVAAGGTPIEAWLPATTPHPAPHPATDWYSQLHQQDLGIQENWHLPHYDDSQWEERMLLDNHHASSNAHGSVWFRKTITLAETLKTPICLAVGRVVDSIKVYVNGALVHTVGYQYPPCELALPEGIFVPGKNVIVLRVEGQSNLPHFTAGKNYALTHHGGSIDLHGPWRVRVGAVMPPAPAGEWHYNVPGCVYNFMLAPVLKYPVSGVIWYQGESNVGRDHEYLDYFKQLVSLFRSHYGEDTPVIYNQLANYVSSPTGSGEAWAALREAQRLALEIPNTAMSVSIDCGEYNDLHPQDKKTVGERLALASQGHSGPLAKSAVIEVDQVRVTFDHGTGLWAKNGRPMLELVDEDGYVHFVYASTQGNQLCATFNPTKVGKVQLVRFGWTDCPPVTLYNAKGLPASSFSLGV